MSVFDRELGTGASLASLLRRVVANARRRRQQRQTPELADERDVVTTHALMAFATNSSFWLF